MNNKQTLFDIVALIAKYVLIIVLIMFFMTQGRRFYDLGYSIFSQSALAPRGEGKVVVVDLVEDMSAQSIGELLAREGLISDATLFRYQERFSDNHGLEKAGSYTLSSDMTPEEMIAVMAGEAPPADSAAHLSAAEVRTETAD